MIERRQLTEIGLFNRPHGINGEINVTIDFQVDLSTLKCIIVDIDGIFVPFFLNNIRKRGSLTFLLTIDGVESDAEAASFTNKKIFALTSELPIDEFEGDNDDDDGFYAEDVIGFNVDDSVAGHIGKVIDVEDSTENILLVVEPSDKSRANILIPFAEELIEEIDPDKQLIQVDLPEGLLTI